MRHLAHDPDTAAIDLWKLRNTTPSEVALGEDGKPGLPCDGQLLISSLAVLSAGQCLALLNAGVQIVTCDGLDTRASQGIGDMHRAVLMRCVKAWAGAATGLPVPVLESGEIDSLRSARESLVGQVLDLQTELAAWKAKVLNPPPKPVRPAKAAALVDA